MDFYYILMFITIILEFFTVVVQWIFVENLLHSRNRKRVSEVLTWLAYAGVFNFLSYRIGNNAWINFASFAVPFFILLRFIYRDKMRYQFFVTIFLYLAGMCSELVTYIIFNSIVLGGKIRITESSNLLLQLIISKLLWFCFLKFILVTMNRNQKSGSNLLDWLEAVFVPVGSVVIFFLFFASDDSIPTGDKYIGIFEVLGIAILFTINIVSYYLYDKGKEVTEKRIKENILQKQCNYYMRQCEESKKLWLELSKFRHDEKQKNIYVRALLENGNYAELKRYYEERQEFLCMRKRVAESGNIFFDSIINYKAELASHEHIQFLLSMEVPCDSRIDGEEISICLGNLLDNAIEAAREVEETGRQIYIKVKVQGANLYLEVRNPYRAPRIMKGKDYATTKKGGVHGWGLQIIREIVNRHNGEMEILDDKNEFRVIVLLYQIVK